MDYEKVVDGIEEFFEGEYHWIGKTVDESQVRGEPQHDPDSGGSKAFAPFDKVFVEQDGGGMTGDDFHGTAFFHIGGGRYATATY